MRSSIKNKSPYFICVVLVVSHLWALKAQATDSTSYISNRETNDGFALSAFGESAPLYISKEDFSGVIRALEDLQRDIKKVTNAAPDLVIANKNPKGKEIVIVGTIGKSTLIDKLISNTVSVSRLFISRFLKSISVINFFINPLLHS